MPGYFFNKISNIISPPGNILQKLSKAGFEQVRDLLFFLPRSLRTRKVQPEPEALLDGDLVVIDVEIHKAYKPGYASRIKYKALGEYKSLPVTITYFAKVPAFILKKFQTEKHLRLQCQIKRLPDAIEIIHPQIVGNEKISELEVIYPKIAGVSNSYLHRLINILLKNIPNSQEWLPPEIISEHDLPPFARALYKLHNPERPEDLKPDSKYMIRLALDELFASQLALKISRKLARDTAGSSFQVNSNLQKQVLDKLGFTLTDGQAKVLAEIEADQFSRRRMLRLLQGDVGSGKTLVALMSLLNVTSAGGQVAFMAPTDILASQHFEFLKIICENFGIRAGLLTGKNTAKQKRQMIKYLKEGVIDLLVGTHALFQDKIEFSNLQYIIVDEQHRFGVKQRIQLVEKGEKPDILIMTATPIPRSLTLTLFGDLDVSRLTSKPSGRQQIHTTIMPVSREEELISSVKNFIECGQQVYWVCPLVEPKEEELNDTANQPKNIMDINTRYDKLSQLIPGKVGYLHGKLKPAQKEQTMQDFKDKNYMILVSTTVIEVGIDIKDANLIVIENADRFGLAQLHQLRGRVGRSSEKSYCILLYNQKTISHTGKRRLSVMKNSGDGFYIAESDLKLRGSGELIGTKQSGEQEFIFADIYEHKELLYQASHQAEKGLSLYNELDKELLSELLNLFGYNSSANAILG
jgi:ATP-dependent DNA helicase RecG